MSFFARAALVGCVLSVSSLPALAQMATPAAMMASPAPMGSMAPMGAMSAPKTFALKAQNASGENGTVTMTPQGDKTLVVIKLTGAPATAQPAHIHMGTCAKLDPKPTYPLTSVVGGASTTTVDVPFIKLMASPFAVNVHKSVAEIATYVSCGDLTSSNMAK